jgi:hypothetical protein
MRNYIARNGKKTVLFLRVILKHREITRKKHIPEEFDMK